MERQNIKTQGLMKRTLTTIIGSFLLLISTSCLFAQGRPYDGPIDAAGDIAAEREGFMTGNRVFLYFRNTSELSDWPRPDVSRWPNNLDGVKMTDGIGLLIGARVYITGDSIPVEDPANFGGVMDTLHFLQTSYREEMDTDPTGTVEWGLYPIFGYFNELNEYPAMSNRSESWPLAGWPSQGLTKKWPGEWNGRFGRGVIYADLETFFVTNDAQDQEYLGPEDRVKYYPRPGHRIGDIRPDVTIQYGKPWGGIGTRVEQRGFQWNNPQSRDAIFWEYNITNISDYDLPEVAFGYWVDNAIGGDADDEIGFFDKFENMAYSWDKDGVGAGGLRTGIMGFAYLESPGVGFDNMDNDDDGIIDERRDNEATSLVGPLDGISDINKFLTAYKLTQEDLREHWDADEDQDWDDGIDTNGDGIYQTTEFAGDDVGTDGVGPNDLNYTGPDANGTEGNHRPDFIEGIGSEPDFATTDVTESDMLGLTAFRLFPVPSHSSEFRWFRGDRSMWDLVSADSLLEFFGNTSNLIEVFASATFPLFKGRTERISMSELHSFDPLQGLNSASHSAPALFSQKRIVQVIYEKDYRFAQPPLMPTLTATPADGRVILTWDNISDTRTRDPFVGNVNDFEGYKLFRATDKFLADAEVITDGFGNPSLKRPIFQCDIIDKRTGFTDFGLVNGTAYYLGEDTGLVHHFIDEEVQNGRTYYYALVAYDYGAPDIGTGVAPSENRIIIDLDEDEEVRSFGQNVAIVTPRPDASGYTPPGIADYRDESPIGNATIMPEVLAQADLKIGHTYSVKMTVDTIRVLNFYPAGMRYVNNGLKVYDVTDGYNLVYSETPEKFSFTNLVFPDTLGYWIFNTTQGEIRTDNFDGMRINLSDIVIDPELDPSQTGWVTGDSRIALDFSTGESGFFPWDYDIVFTDDPAAFKNRLPFRSLVRGRNGGRTSRFATLEDQDFSFYIVNKSIPGDTLEMVVHDLNDNDQFDLIGDEIIVGGFSERQRWAGSFMVMDFNQLADASQLPQPGDVYRIRQRRPFAESDSVVFSIQAAGELDRAAIRNSMDDIRVVPNPYVMTNAMEPAVRNQFLNQRRRLLFTNLPARCTIKILTVSGVVVNELNVENSADSGIVHWDLRSREGLEVAAGMYIYHVEATETGDEKIGKFAIVK